MIKRIIIISIMLLLLTVITASADTSNSKNPNTIDVPEHSRIVNLGNGIMRYDQVHYSTDNGWFNNNAITEPNGSINDYLLMGVKWITAEPFVINPTGYAGNDMQNVIEISLNTWDIEVRKNIFGDVVVDDTISQVSEYDLKNTVTFAEFDNDGIIAMASTWYTLRGKKIVESDVMFNTHFDWGNANIDTSKMDLQNIATHELGHSAGLLDLYLSGHSELTMFGYSTEGDIEKRTLESGDILGIHAIYGK